MRNYLCTVISVSELGATMLRWSVGDRGFNSALYCPLTLLVRVLSWGTAGELRRKGQHLARVQNLCGENDGGNPPMVIRITRRCASRLSIRKSLSFSYDESSSHPCPFSWCVRIGSRTKGVCYSLGCPVSLPGPTDCLTR